MSQFEWIPDRRRAPRVDLLADLHGHLVTLDEQVQVKQISLGGMTIETTAPLSPRLVHDFRVTFSDRAVTLRGRVIHGRVAVAGDAVTYVSGVQFVDPPPEALTAVREFVDTLRAGDEETR